MITERGSGPAAAALGVSRPGQVAGWSVRGDGGDADLEPMNMSSSLSRFTSENGMIDRNRLIPQSALDLVSGFGNGIRPATIKTPTDACCHRRGRSCNQSSAARKLPNGWLYSARCRFDCGA